MDEDDRLALALLAVGKSRSVDFGCLGILEPGARHLVRFTCVHSPVKHIGSRGLVGLKPQPKSTDNEGLYKKLKRYGMQ